MPDSTHPRGGGVISFIERADAIADAARAEYCTARELAERFGAGTQSVRNICRKRGIPLRPDVRGGAAQARNGGRRLSDRENKTRARWLALSERGLTAAQAARKMSVSVTAAYKAAQRYGFEWRRSGLVGRPRKEPEPVIAPPMPRITIQKPAKRSADPLRGCHVISLRGGWQTYERQIMDEVLRAPPGKPVVYSISGKGECQPAKKAAQVAALKVKGKLRVWQVCAGREPQFAYAIERVSV